MKKITVIILLLIVCTLLLTAGYFFLPKHVPCNKSIFAATKQLKLEFQSRMPFYKVDYYLNVTYLGETPAYVQPVGSDVVIARSDENRSKLLAPGQDSTMLASKSYLMFPGDAYRSWIGDESITIVFDYAPIESTNAGADGLSFVRSQPSLAAKFNL